jgi:mRNA-degrading endonuclease HigB of HigAB toxin-antitoxin module
MYKEVNLKRIIIARNKVKEKWVIMEVMQKKYMVIVMVI